MTCRTATTKQLLWWPLQLGRVHWGALQHLAQWSPKPTPRWKLEWKQRQNQNRRSHRHPKWRLKVSRFNNFTKKEMGSTRSRLVLIFLFLKPSIFLIHRKPRCQEATSSGEVLVWRDYGSPSQETIGEHEGCWAWGGQHESQCWFQAHALQVPGPCSSQANLNSQAVLPG